MDAATRRQLRAALTARFAWVTDGDVGPAAVEAGECDRCGQEARLVMTCGPAAWRYLGRTCVRTLGTAAWCDGHADTAITAAAALAALPAEADTVARLWWVATGEVALDPRLRQDMARLALPGS